MLSVLRLTYNRDWTISDKDEAPTPFPSLHTTHLKLFLKKVIQLILISNGKLAIVLTSFTINQRSSRARFSTSRVLRSQLRHGSGPGNKRRSSVTGEQERHLPTSEAFNHRMSVKQPPNDKTFFPLSASLSESLRRLASERPDIDQNLISSGRCVGNRWRWEERRSAGFIGSNRVKANH